MSPQVAFANQEGRKNPAHAADISVVAVNAISDAWSEDHSMAIIKKRHEISRKPHLFHSLS